MAHIKRLEIGEASTIRPCHGHICVPVLAQRVTRFNEALHFFEKENFIFSANTHNNNAF
jgi:hypothetical protein